MQRVAATRIRHGSDVDFGSLTRNMVEYLQSQPNFELMLSSPVHYIDQRDNGRWKVRVKTNTPVSRPSWKVNLFSWARAVGHCLCCRNQALMKPVVTVGSLLVANGLCVANPT